MCKILKLPKSTYYAFKNKKDSKRKILNACICKDIMQIYIDSKQRYGAPKIHKVLLKKGTKISIKKVQRLMRYLNISSIVVKKYRPVTSKAAIEEKSNILKRDFSTKRLNEKWVTDITYIHTQQDGWCYLAAVMDLHSKKIVGYSFSKKIDAALAIKALDNAVRNRKIRQSLILHSDLGSQFTSNNYKKYIQNIKLIEHSFSSKGCPYDNAGIESFFSILKKEEVYKKRYKNYNEAWQSIFEFIESWYNLNRIHSALNYLTPCEKEMLVA